MSKLYTAAELSGLTLFKLEALYRTVHMELVQSQPGSVGRQNALASLANISRAIANRRSFVPRP